jgi:ceramide glucosyltransferase
VTAALVIIGNLFAAGALIGLIYLVVTLLALARFGRRARNSGRPTAPVTILKPVCGEDPGLYDNLASFCRQDYDGPVQIVIGAHRDSDAAVPVARRLIADFPDRDITLAIDGALPGTNYKICNIVNMMPAAKHDVIVLSDSDMRVTPDYLGAVVAPLFEPGIGATTTLYKARPVGGLVSRLACGFINYGFLPSVLVGRLLKAAPPFCSGSTIALRRRTLQQIGGFEAFLNQLADDFEIGERVRGLGLDVTLASYVIENVVREPDLASLFQHELRWQRTVRHLAPIGLAASVITYPLALALIALPLLGFTPGAWLLLGCSLATRLGVVYMCDRLFDLEPMGAALVPLRDLLSLLVLAASFFGQRVTWRDSHFQVGRSGELRLEGDELA